MILLEGAPDSLTIASAMPRRGVGSARHVF